MRLNKISIEHFKGVDSLEVVLDGENATIRGANGAGKTTIADAYAWVIFGKSFTGEMLEPEIKRRDVKTGLCPNDGGVVHAAEVEMVLDSGEIMTLRKEYVEQWQKKRGAAESEFRGHTTNYYVNEAPLSKKAYEGKVAEIIPEDVGRLLSIPLHFCHNVKWQDRRKLLKELAKDALDAGILSDSELEKFSPVMDELKSKSIDEYRAMLKAQMKKVNEEVKTIPARIDEITSFDFAATDGLSKEELEAEVKSLSATVKKARDKMSQLENGGANFERNQKLMEIEAAQWKIINGLESEYSRKKNEAESVVRGCESEIARIEAERVHKLDKLNAIYKCIETAEKQAVSLRSDWIKENASEANFEISDTCPTCGQHLPLEQIEKAREKAVAAFNIKKAEKLKEIAEKGKRIMQQKATDEQSAVYLEKFIEDTELRTVELKKQLENAKSLLSNEKPDFKQNEDWRKLEVQRIDLDQRKGIAIEENEEIKKAKAEISKMEAEIAERNEKIAAFAQIEQVKKRKEELLAREQDLGKQYSELELKLDLLEQFMRRKVELTEEAINNHFQYVHWTMFRIQVNGGIEECCDATIDGVPVGAGLNTGGEMKAALDILNVLSEHYGLRLPVIIDNAERYTSGSIIPVDNQMIWLAVCDGEKIHPRLTIEIEGKEPQEIMAISSTHSDRAAA